MVGTMPLPSQPKLVLILPLYSLVSSVVKSLARHLRGPVSVLGPGKWFGWVLRACYEIKFSGSYGGFVCV